LGADYKVVRAKGPDRSGASVRAAEANRGSTTISFAKQPEIPIRSELIEKLLCNCSIINQTVRVGCWANFKSQGIRIFSRTKKSKNVNLSFVVLIFLFDLHFNNE
jgi:hypothetical protein